MTDEGQGSAMEVGSEDRAKPGEIEERYRLLFQQSPVGVLHYDRELVVNDCNESLCTILDSSFDRLLGLDMRTLRDRRVLPALEDALEGHRGYYEGPYRSTTGGTDREISITLRTVPFHDADGRVVGGIGIVEDVTERREIEEVQTAIYELSEAAHSADSLDHLFRSIHDILGRLMPAENLFVALYDPGTDTVRFPYFVDRYDDPPPPQRARKGLTEYVLKSGDPLLATRETLEDLVESGEITAGGSWPSSWMGAPLKTNRGAIGVLCLQSYEPEVIFEDRDCHILSFVAGQAAMAIERHQHRAEIEKMAYFDTLTGLHNRRMLQERSEQALALAARYDYPVSLLYLDLDRFKNVNDTLGHDAGDDLLMEIAGLLKECLRRSDTLARLGGDEFAFVLIDADTHEASQTAGRVLRTLDRPFDVHGQRVHIGGSVGIATFPEHGRSLDDLLKHADIAMFRAKTEGSSFAVYDATKSPFSRGRLELEAELREAISENALEVWYQPIVEADGGRVVSREALLRWRRGDEILRAGAFVPLAEESELIRHLDRLVLAIALRAAGGWMAAGDGAEVTVNLSGRSIARRSLPGHVAELAETCGVPPARVVLEVTERSAVGNAEATGEVLAELKRFGFRLAMDDFGSGFASLTYLRELPFDRVKIDKGLVAEIGKDERGEKLVEAAIRLGQGLGLEVVGEGVERPEQREWLIERGCGLLQGFLIGEPEEYAEAGQRGKGGTS